ncbi:hypothetical protein [Streptomyces canus]|uniref:hypothetical protein n=1 Tax=Streptomyces canus TaxID=58343 RepID=UPI000747DE72|nr:hypothetical protein [Streptomyces canus]KUN11817.1 hypothetical protein AQI96_19035 [Streptomyces canus]
MTTATAPVYATDQDRRAWVAPLVATILLVLLGPAALFLGGLSAMATDSCGPDDCPSALMTSLTVIYGILEFGILVTLPAYVASWALPWHGRWSVLRAWLAAVAVLPPLTVLVLVFTLPMP